MPCFLGEGCPDRSQTAPCLSFPSWNGTALSPPPPPPLPLPPRAEAAGWTGQLCGDLAVSQRIGVGKGHRGHSRLLPSRSAPKFENRGTPHSARGGLPHPAARGLLGLAVQFGWGWGWGLGGGARHPNPAQRPGPGAGPAGFWRPEIAARREPHAWARERRGKSRRRRGSQGPRGAALSEGGGGEWGSGIWGCFLYFTLLPLWENESKIRPFI
jgi:hypothetical protein